MIFPPKSMILLKPTKALKGFQSLIAPRSLKPSKAPLSASRKKPTLTPAPTPKTASGAKYER